MEKLKVKSRYELSPSFYFMLNERSFFKAKMRKGFFLSVLIFCLCAGEASCQEIEAPTKLINKVGVIIGLNFMFPDDHGYAEYVHNDNPNISYKLTGKAGYLFGIESSHSIGKRFEISGRLVYERKNFSEENSYILDNDDRLKFIYDTENDYASINLFPTYFLNSKKSFLVFTGGFFNYLIRSYFNSTEYLNGNKQSVNWFKGNAKDYEAGLLMGIGFSFPVTKKTSTTTQLQWNVPFTDIINENQMRISSNSLMLSISLNINNF